MDSFLRNAPIYQRIWTKIYVNDSSRSLVINEQDERKVEITYKTKRRNIGETDLD